MAQNRRGNRLVELQYPYVYLPLPVSPDFAQKNIIGVFHRIVVTGGDPFIDLYDGSNTLWNSTSAIPIGSYSMDYISTGQTAYTIHASTSVKMTLVFKCNGAQM